MLRFVFPAFWEYEKTRGIRIAPRPFHDVDVSLFFQIRFDLR